MIIMAGFLIMEIYKDSSDRKVSIAVPLTPEPGTTEALIFNNEGETVAEILTFTTETDGHSIVVPFSVIDNYDEFRVQFNFEYLEQGVVYNFSRDVHVDVVTPFLTTAEVKAILGNVSDAQAIEAERLVRFIISAHTGQTFSRSRKTYRLKGNGRGFLELPNKLLEITKFNGLEGLPYPFYVSSDGWYIRGGVAGVPNIKADWYGLHEINGTVYNEYNVLPEWFANTRNYIIDGVWGWYEVPTEIKEAAKLLINDYACDDSIYRDRYVDVVQAVDWRLEFSTGAFTKTGNVKADQLLRNFVLSRGWAVI